MKSEVILKPQDYLKLYEEHPEQIKHARIIPPRIGIDKHFGKIAVVFAGRYYGADYGQQYK